MRSFGVPAWRFGFSFSVKKRDIFVSHPVKKKVALHEVTFFDCWWAEVTFLYLMQREGFVALVCKKETQKLNNKTPCQKPNDLMGSLSTNTRAI